MQFLPIPLLNSIQIHWISALTPAPSPRITFTNLCPLCYFPVYSFFEMGWNTCLFGPALCYHIAVVFFLCLKQRSRSSPTISFLFATLQSCPPIYLFSWWLFSPGVLGLKAMWQKGDISRSESRQGRARRQRRRWKDWKSEEKTRLTLSRALFFLGPIESVAPGILGTHRGQENQVWATFVQMLCYFYSSTPFAGWHFLQC